MTASVFRAGGRPYAAEMPSVLKLFSDDVGRALTPRLCMSCDTLPDANETLSLRPLSPRMFPSTPVVVRQQQSSGTAEHGRSHLRVLAEGATEAGRTSSHGESKAFATLVVQLDNFGRR